MDTLSLTKEAKIYNLFNKWCWENWSTTCKRMKLGHFLTPYTKINSKWIKNLNVRPGCTTLLRENIGNIPLDINLSNNFLDLTTKRQTTKIGKWIYIKLRSTWASLAAQW